MKRLQMRANARQWLRHPSSQARLASPRCATTRRAAGSSAGDGISPAARGDASELLLLRQDLRAKDKELQKSQETLQSWFVTSNSYLLQLKDTERQQLITDARLKNLTEKYLRSKNRFNIRGIIELALEELHKNLVANSPEYRQTFQKRPPSSTWLLAELASPKEGSALFEESRLLDKQVDQFLHSKIGHDLATKSSMKKCMSGLYADLSKHMHGLNAESIEIKVGEGHFAPAQAGMIYSLLVYLDDRVSLGTSFQLTFEEEVSRQL